MEKFVCKCDCNCINKNDADRARQKLREVDGDLSHLTEFFKTFADNTRLKIICILDEVKSMCVGDIAVALNMTKSAISHQLKYLRKNNLVVASKQGKQAYYSLSDDHVKLIFEMGIMHIREKN